tara:strand:+ start:30 stop:473 length:444 start_codon:yes stop_codon:yes gene_type:complete
MKKLLYLKDHQLKQYIEKIFNGYRETVADAKKVLDKHALGTAHNKVIHLISLYEGITISSLLRKLKVTKQSLNRVLNDLVDIKAIEFKRDEIDTRVKHVFLTAEGEKIFDEIFSAQKKRIYDAFLSSESNDVISFDKVLKKIINEKL